MTLEQEEFLMLTAMVAACGAILGIGVGWNGGNAPERTFQSTFVAVTLWGMFCTHGSAGYIEILKASVVVLFTALSSSLAAYAGCRFAGSNQNKACLFSSVPAGAIAPTLFYYFFIR